MSYRALKNYNFNINDIRYFMPSFAGKDIPEMITMMQTLNSISDEMEPFSGNPEEAQLLAHFLQMEKDTSGVVKEGGN